jgi:heat shock protein HslJ
VGGAPTSASGQSSDLINTKWILAGYRTAAGRTVEPVPGSSASLLFQRPGKVSGNTGCNEFSGTYEALNRTLTINLGPITTMACDGELGTQQDAVLDNLAKVALFSAEGGRLVLADGSKTTLLTYNAS